MKNRTQLNGRALKCYICCSLNKFQVKMISNWFDLYFPLFKG